MGVKEKFIAEVESWVGTPYVFEGCTKGKDGGSNCGHWLLACIEKTMPIGDTLKFAWDFNHLMVVREHKDVFVPTLALICNEVPFQEVAPGDICLILFRGVPTMPAICVQDNVFVYSRPHFGIVRDSLPFNYYKRITHTLRPKWEEWD